MNEEQTQQAQQDEAAFAAGFAEVSGQPAPAAPAQEQPAAEAKPEEQPKTEGTTETLAAAATTTTTDETPRIAGLSEEEVKTLLSRVPELESQLRKIHGKLGEYGGVIQELRKAPAKPSLTPEKIQEIEAAHPDIAAYVNARMPASEQPAPEQAPQQHQAPPSQPDLQAELMDHFHEGWREKIVSQDFLLWIAAQPEDVRNTFNTTEKARELNAVITKFDAWNAAKQTQQAKSSARLQNALTPAGTTGKPKTAPSEEDAFKAGFDSVMAGR